MKTDLKREIAAYRARAGAFEIVDVPPLRYLMLDGEGDPNTPEYAEAVAAIFGVAYRLKFLSKRTLDRDYVVMPLEALWSSADMASFTTARDKTRWQWTLLNLVPEGVGDDVFEQARTAVAGSAAVERLRLETYAEGRCVQTLHIGPFDAEGPVLDEMHSRFIPEHGLRMTGRHHEIYFSDLRRTDPARLRTILRQPVEETAAAS
jgi:hypothetical protein